MATSNIRRKWMIIGKGLLLLVLLFLFYQVIDSNILYKSATQIIKIFNSDLEYVTYFEHSRTAFITLVIPVICFLSFHFDTRKKKKRIPQRWVTVFIALMSLSAMYITLTYTAMSGSELVVRNVYLNEKRYPIHEILFTLNEVSGSCHRSRGTSYPCIRTHLVLMHRGHVLLTDNNSQYMFSTPDPFAPHSVFLSELIKRGAQRLDE